MLRVHVGEAVSLNMEEEEDMCDITRAQALLMYAQPVRAHTHIHKHAHTHVHMPHLRLGY